MRSGRGLEVAWYALFVLRGRLGRLVDGFGGGRDGGSRRGFS